MRHDTQQAPVFRSGSFFVVTNLFRECGPQDLTQGFARGTGQSEIQKKEQGY